MSQLHAVDGGTAYGLPHDSLMPPVRAQGTLSCYGAINALFWWMRTGACGGFQLSPRPLSPRGLFELCLREAEVAADCWRRRNGLPTAAAAAGGAGRASGSSSNSCSGKAASSRRQRGQGEVVLLDAESGTGRHAGLCRTGGGAAARTASGGSGSGPAADRPRATLEPSQCPDLAMQAMACSLALMKSSCGAGAAAGAGAGEAEARVSKGTGGGTCIIRMDRFARLSGNIAAAERARGARGVGSGDGMQGSSSSPGEEAHRSASVGVSGGGREGQGGGADTGTGSGGCGDVAEETRGSGSGSGNQRPAAWLGDGGPLARRWWRAAAAAVHCAMDEREAVGSQAQARGVDQVLDLSPAMPVSDPGGTQHALRRVLIMCMSRATCSIHATSLVQRIGFNTTD